jgi:hypothetical protein
MEAITVGLFVFVLVLLFANIVIDIQQGDFLGVGYLTGVKQDSFTPMSYAYEAQEPIFQPEGYGKLGQYHGWRLMPYVNRRVDTGGIPNAKLRELYPADYYQHFIT